MKQKTNYKRVYCIVMICRKTGEKTLFGEIKMNYADTTFLEVSLSHNNLNHRFELIGKDYAKANQMFPYITN